MAPTANLDQKDKQFVAKVGHVLMEGGALWGWPPLPLGEPGPRRRRPDLQAPLPRPWGDLPPLHLWLLVGQGWSPLPPKSWGGQSLGRAVEATGLPSTCGLTRVLADAPLRVGGQEAGCWPAARPPLAGGAQRSFSATSVSGKGLLFAHRFFLPLLWSVLCGKPPSCFDLGWCILQPNGEGCLFLPVAGHTGCSLFPIGEKGA